MSVEAKIFHNLCTGVRARLSLPDKSTLRLPRRACSVARATAAPPPTRGDGVRSGCDAPAQRSGAEQIGLFETFDTVQETHTGMEEPSIDRLDDIVVGASLESRYLVVNAGAIGEQHDRQALEGWGRADLFAQIQPAAIGEVNL